MKKLAKDTAPSNHTFADFISFGPTAEKDGEFDNVMMADLGCFNQDGIDTNKMYFAAVLQSSKTNKWFSYFEWGKVGGYHQYQFLSCDSKDEAIKELHKQLHSKNDKRGEWYDHASLGRLLRAKKGKDCYLIRKQTSRNVYIDSAKNISNEVKKVAVAASKKTPNLHPECLSLLKDLQLGSVSYTRSSMISGDIPTQSAIDEARLILKEASSTTKDTELVELTRILYCRIPKIKYKGDVTLSSDNICAWANDLDAFESAIGNSSSDEIRYDNFIPIEYVEKTEPLWLEIDKWINSATRNKHSYLPGKMNIRNIFRLNNDVQYNKFKSYRSNVIAENAEKPLHQPAYDKLKSDCNKSNTATLFHGTRSVNTSGILKSGKLMLPKALSGVSINGSLYGSGNYFADDWKKSAGYCTINNSVWVGNSGKINNRHAFMFLAHTILGNIKVEMSPRGYNQPPVGFHSVMGKAGTNVLNNEFVTYNEDANILQYLIEFSV